MHREKKSFPKRILIFASFLSLQLPPAVPQQMVADRDKHATLIARQSRTLLRQMIRGMWDFMEQLDLDELETDEVIEEMIEFVNFMQEHKKDGEAGIMVEEFRPSRVLDHDTLRMKLDNV